MIDNEISTEMRKIISDGVDKAANAAQEALVNILYKVATGQLKNQHVHRNDMDETVFARLTYILNLIEKGRTHAIQERSVKDKPTGKISILRRGKPH